MFLSVAPCKRKTPGETLLHCTYCRSHLQEDLPATDATVSTSRPRAILPALEKIYLPLDTFAETLLRVLCGVLLVTHGYGKIINPFGAVGMVESLGFYPGVFWSPLLAATRILRRHPDRDRPSHPSGLRLPR